MVPEVVAVMPEIFDPPFAVFFHALRLRYSIRREGDRLAGGAVTATG